jgi:4-amino-4-deoxy-L-arabinose transferase-like glycosyltransferase
MRLISKNIFIGILTALIGFRLFLSAIIPLTETTEARYGEIARKMLETGNWINLLDTYHLYIAGYPLAPWQF